MAHLHSPEINLLHRDLKASNVVVTIDSLSRVKAKICDFGISLCHIFDTESSDKRLINNYLTTHAPECLHSRDISHPKSEVFTYGVILWEMLTLLPSALYNSAGKLLGDDEIKRYIAQGNRLPLPSTAELNTKSQECRDYIELINMCWKQNLEERPSFEEVIKYIESKFQIEQKQSRSKSMNSPVQSNAVTKNDFKEFDFFYDANPQVEDSDDSSDSDTKQTSEVDSDTGYKQAVLADADANYKQAALDVV